MLIAHPAVEGGQGRVPGHRVSRVSGELPGHLGGVGGSQIMRIIRLYALVIITSASPAESGSSSQVQRLTGNNCHSHPKKEII